MYVCKIASYEEMNQKWDDEIQRHEQDRENWILWKQQFLENFRNGSILSYYGILDKNIICEATAMLKPQLVQNSEGLVGEHMAYLSAFRTVEEYQGMGYFSKLIKFMLADLKQKGFTKVTLGVEPAEETNQRIYAHLGFHEYIKSATEVYPDGTVIDVDYYGKAL